MEPETYRYSDVSNGSVCVKLIKHNNDESSSLLNIYLQQNQKKKSDHAKK